MKLSPFNKVRAGTPEDVGTLNAEALGIIVGGQKKSGRHGLVQLEHPLRWTVKRQAALLSDQAQTSFAGAVVEVNDVELLRGEIPIDEIGNSKAAVLEGAL